MIRGKVGNMLGAWALVRVWGAVILFAFAVTFTARAAPLDAALVNAGLVYEVPNVAPSAEPTVEELKARLASTAIGDRPHLCVEIAQRQLVEADKLYAADELEKGETALADVVSYFEQARDYAIQSHKHLKETEIAARTMTRKLTDLLRTLGHDDQAPVRDAITHLEKVRDDLLKAMFPKGAK
jgi:hypothetical protein